MDSLRMVPLNQLVASTNNPRKTAASAEADAMLLASLRAHGLLMPLLVREGNAGQYEVIAGDRRLKHLRALAEEDGRLPDDVQVPVMVRNFGAGASRAELAAAENMVRTDMHPLDECEAIQILIGEDGVADTEAVARRFGRPVLWVQQRLKLAGLALPAQKLFRDGVLGMSAAMALTLGTVEQQAAWVKNIKDRRDWRCDAGTIKQNFTEKKIPASRAMFDLGLYPAGAIERDLFSEEVWLTDREAFDKLQQAAFDQHVETLRRQGWGEVHVLNDDDGYKLKAKYVAVSGRIRKADRAKLAAFITYVAHNGSIRVESGWALRSMAKKIQKNGTHVEDTTTAAEVKRLQPYDLTKGQAEQLTVMMQKAIAEQCMVYDTVALWTLIGPLLQTDVPWSKQGRGLLGSESDPQEPYKTLNEITVPTTLSAFEELSPKDRMRLVRLAAMLMVKPCQPEPVLDEWDLQGWFRPDATFVNGWRTDQLIAYEKAIGAPSLMKHSSVKKADHVNNILSTLESGKGTDPIPPLAQFFGVEPDADHVAAVDDKVEEPAGVEDDDDDPFEDDGESAAEVVEAAEVEQPKPARVALKAS